MRHDRINSYEKGHRLLLRKREGKREVRGRWILDNRIYGLARNATIHDGSMTMQVLLDVDEDGWWYAAQLPDDRVVVLFASEVETARVLKARGMKDSSDCRVRQNSSRRRDQL